MNQEPIIPEVLDPDEGGHSGGHEKERPGEWPSGSLHNQGFGPEYSVPSGGSLGRILSPIKALVVGTLILGGIALAVVFGGVLLVAFMVVFFISFLISGLFGRRGAGTGSIIVERYGPGGQSQVKFTGIGPSGDSRGSRHPGDPT